MQSFTLEELAKATNSKLVGNPDYRVIGVADLQSATQADISFLANTRYEQAMRKSQAGAVFIDPSVEPVPGRNFLINPNPSLAFQLVINSLHAHRKETMGFKGIHPTAIIHASCAIAEDATIGPYTVIDKGVSIGARTMISAGCYIGPFTTIGEDCLFHSGVQVREQCRIENRVILQPGAVIGSCGFGYTTDNTGKHAKLDQVGNVILEDDVEIGANTTIDRARFKSTRIGKGTKIDNLVQIGHGVEIGESNIIVAQTGVAGSTTTGRNVVLGGQVAVNGHIHLADGVMVAGCSGVSKSLFEAGKYNGIPALPAAEYNRNVVHLRKIEDYAKRLSELEKQVNKLLQSKS